MVALAVAWASAWHTRWILEVFATSLQNNANDVNGHLNWS